MSNLRGAALVALFEWSEALRSRRALVFLALHMGASAAGSILFLRLLSEIEGTLADTLAVASTSDPGAMTGSVVTTPEFLNVVSRLVGDRALAEQLVQIPPLSLFYGWLVLTLLPVLVMLSSADAISAELQTGSSRYAMVRTGRLAWAGGKFAGHLGLMATGVLLGGMTTWLVGYTQSSGFQALPVAEWILSLSLRALFYGFAFVGLALGLSSLTRSVPISRGVALLSLGVLAFARRLLNSEWAQDSIPILSSSLVQLLPRTHLLDLWRPSLDGRLPGMVALLAIGVGSFAIGHRVRARLDA